MVYRQSRTNYYTDATGHRCRKPRQWKKSRRDTAKRVCVADGPQKKSLSVRKRALHQPPQPQDLLRAEQFAPAQAISAKISETFTEALRANDSRSRKNPRRKPSS